MKSGGPAPGGEGLRARIAGAREAIERSLRDVAAEVQRDEIELRAKAADELARIASAELERALREWERAAEATLGRDRLELEVRLDERFIEAVDEAIGKIRMETAERARELDRRIDASAKAGVERVDAALDATRAEARGAAELVATELQRELTTRMQEFEATSSRHAERRFSELEKSLMRRVEILADQADTRLAAAETNVWNAGAEALRVRVATAENALAEAAAAQRAELAENAETFVSSRLSDAVQSLGERGELKLEAVRELTSSALAEIEQAREGLARKDRRQALKLVRAERSRRARKALAALERKGEEHVAGVRAEGERASEMLQAAEQRVRDATAQLERGAGEAGERVTAAVARAESAVERIERTQSHATEFEGAAKRAAAQATRAAELAADAAALEQRVREAIEREESTAEQMRAIERRLLDLLNSG